jgi:hypothetical protein
LLPRSELPGPGGNGLLHGPDHNQHGHTHRRLCCCSSPPHLFPIRSHPFPGGGFSLTFPPQTFSPLFSQSLPENVTGGYLSSSSSSSSLQSLRLVVFDDSRNLFWFYFFFAFVASTNENEVAMNLAQFSLIYSFLFLFFWSLFFLFFFCLIVFSFFSTLFLGCFDECCHDVKQQQFVDLELLAVCVSINRSINSSESALF